MRTILFLTVLLSLNRAFAQRQMSNDDTCAVAWITHFLTYNFSYAELDSFRIRTFVKNSDFKLPVDSFSIRVVRGQYKNGANLISLGAGRAIPCSVDWEVIFNDSLVYKVTNVVAGNLHQHGQVILRCVIKSYRINGKPKNKYTGSTIAIEKWAKE